MRQFVKRFIQSVLSILDFIPRNFLVLLSPIKNNEKEMIAHFSQYAKIFSTHSEMPGSVTLHIRATRRALRLAINKLGNDINAGYEEITRRRPHEEANILAFKTD